MTRVCRFIALCTEKTLEAYLWASQEYTMEVEGEESINLPPNLVEDSIEAVDTAVKRRGYHRLLSPTLRLS